MMMNFIFRPAAALVRALSSPAHALLLAWAYVSIIFIPLTASAQTGERDPLNTQMTVPLPPYPSAFSDYKPYQDPELMPWKTANDVVREFGGMAGMEGMDGSKDTVAPDGMDGTKSLDGEKQSKPAIPPDDTENMKGKTMPPAPKKPVSSNGKSSGMEDMPGHDMSKMKGSAEANKIKAAPERDLKNKGGMADMPGHDMGSMQQKVPPAPKTKSPPSSGKPAVPAPMTMPDHSGMSK